MMHHHLAVKSNPEKTKFGFGGNEQPVCPKPRRLIGSSIPEYLNPLLCTKHSQANTDGKSGILNMISGKAIDGRESICSSCAPPCYCGSPPGRTKNPLVHDLQFIHQIEPFSPLSRTNLCDKFEFTSPI